MLRGYIPALIAYLARYDLLPPDNFTNPHETAIHDLQKQYTKALAEGKVFEELRVIKERIKVLKSELKLQRSKEPQAKLKM